jgi:multidrug resistance efflux pump
MGSTPYPNFDMKIHALEQKLARADTRIAELEAALTVRDTEIARLETDLELARMDAGRYRWLRMNRLWLKARLYEYGDHVPMLAAPELDAAIDAARAGNGGDL